jgi:hypothetical protein
MSPRATNTFLKGYVLVSPVLKQYYLLQDSASWSYYIHIDRYPTRNNLLVLFISSSSYRGTTC